MFRVSGHCPNDGDVQAGHERLLDGFPAFRFRDGSVRVFDFVGDFFHFRIRWGEDCGMFLIVQSVIGSSQLELFSGKCEKNVHVIFR